jgi:LPS export ABC transporter protein LptC
MNRLVICLPILFLTLGCQNKQELASNPSEVNDLPDQESWGAHLTTSSNGKLASRINYGHLQRFSKKKLVKFADGVQIDLYGDDGRHVSTANCNEAVLNETTNNLELSGEVKIVSENGLNVKTTKLLWNEDQEKITSDEFVRVITADQDTIFGIGFESEKSLDNWTIRKPWGVTQKKLNLKITQPSDEATNDEP